MAISTQDIDFTDPIRDIGPDSTALFEESPSNRSEYLSNENLSAASKLDEDEDEEDDEDGEDEEDLDDEDEEEEEDEDDEDEDEDEEEDDEDDEEDDEDELKVTRRR
jgi:hypothetical protein